MGKLQGTFGVRYSPAYFLPHLVLFVLELLGFGIFYGAPAGWKAWVSAVFFLLLGSPFVGVVIKTVWDWPDELKVYDDGFTYKNRRGLHTCKWDQMRVDGEVLDTDNRLKITSVRKKGGETIAFAYKMRGLDLLDHLFSQYEFDKIPTSQKTTTADIAAEPTTLGELKGTYRVRRTALDYMPLFLVTFLAAIGVLMSAVKFEILKFAVCTVPLIIPFLIIVRMMIIERRDMMQLYENGFKYFERTVETTCLWSEIDDYSRAGASFAGPESLTGIKKTDGTWIHFADQMQGLDQISPHLRTIVHWTGTEE